jgi:hypothetical protein
LAASTAPTAKTNLLTAIRARPALISGVYVDRGPLPDPPSELERIYIGDAVDFDREWAQLGAQRIREEYTVLVIVENVKYGNEPKDTEERTFTLANEVEQAVRTDLTLAAAVIVAQPRIRRQQLAPLDEGWIGVIELGVFCKATI